MKKSLYAILVILLTFVGAHALASEFDVNVNKSVSSTSDSTSNDNEGGRSCGSTIGK